LHERVDLAHINNQDLADKMSRLRMALDL